jgi:hypothetical protein
MLGLVADIVALAIASGYSFYCDASLRYTQLLLVAGCFNLRVFSVNHSL